MHFVSNQIATNVTTIPMHYSLSIIVPVFNEAEGLYVFHHELCKSLATLHNESLELIYINDGSTDNSWDIIQQLRCNFADLRKINLSRNFGKEAAMTAGIEICTGEAVSILDADLQDPPSLLPHMLTKLREGYDVVNMKRRSRGKEGLFKTASAKIYYKLLGLLADTPLEKDVGDFRMLSQRVVHQIKQLPERNRYTKGIMSWPGFKQTILEFDRPIRTMGDSKWTIWQLLSLALSGITAFSVKPLRIATCAGLMVACCAFLFGIWVLVRTIVFGEPVAGYPSIMLILLSLGAAQLLGLGVIGEYLGRVFIESKGRPIYIVMEQESTLAKNSLRNNYYE